MPARRRMVTNRIKSQPIAADPRQVEIDLAPLADPTSLVYRDRKHIKDIESRYGASILDLARLVDNWRANGRA